MSGGPSGSAVADIDGDGGDEIVCALLFDDQIAIVSGLGGSVARFHAGPGPTSCEAADLDLDGRIDVVVASSGDIATVLRGTGAIELETARSFGAGSSFSRIVAADVNGDSYPDLVGIGASLVVFANRGSDCGRGSVDSGAGGASNVLRVNGTAGGARRTVVAARRTPLEITLEAPPAGPAEARYVLFLWEGHAVKPAAIVRAGRARFCLVNPTPLASPSAPQPVLALLGEGLPRGVALGVRRLGGSPPLAPFSLRHPFGLPRSTIVTLQGFLEDLGSSSLPRFSSTNAVTLVIR